MTTQLGKSQFTPAMAACALLLGFYGSVAFASNGTDVDSNDVISDEPPTPALPSPSLNIAASDRGLSDVAAANMQTLPAERASDRTSSPVLAEDSELVDDTERESEDVSGVPASDPPETALRLPGVAEEDLPHFRRQMYRTDI